MLEIVAEDADESDEVMKQKAEEEPRVLHYDDDHLLMMTWQDLEEEIESDEKTVDPFDEQYFAFGYCYFVDVELSVDYDEENPKILDDTLLDDTLDTSLRHLRSLWCFQLQRHESSDASSK